APVQIGVGLWGMATGDFNGDGRADAVDYRGFALAQPDGSFGPRTAIPWGLPYPPYLMAAGDLNGDGFDDIVGHDHDSFAVAISRGDATFDISPPDRRAGGSASMAIVDLDGDGHQDLLVGIEYNQRRLQVLYGVGDGTFAIVGGVSVAYDPWTFVTVDLDGDGDLDIVSTGQSRVENRGGRRYAAPVSGCTGVPGLLGFDGVAAGDANGDGHADIVLSAHGNGGYSSARLILGDGTFGCTGPGQPLPGPLVSGIGAVALFDLDGDGRDEIAVGGDNSNTIIYRLVVPQP
ncbi:MAG: VCBS repeat-containing protein, partial [Myxococcales bacterium]|nr:VCBS repeat-containing protein [Myxococcales bacterium]